MDQLTAETKAALAPAVAVAAQAAEPAVAEVAGVEGEEVAPFNEDVFRIRERAAGLSYR